MNGKTDSKAKTALGIGAGFVDQAPRLNMAGKAETDFVRVLSYWFHFLRTAARHLQLQFIARRQRVEKAHTHPGFRYVADHADKLTIGRNKFGCTDKQGEARGGALLRTAGHAVAIPWNGMRLGKGCVFDTHRVSGE